MKSNADNVLRGVLEFCCWTFTAGLSAISAYRLGGPAGTPRGAPKNSNIKLIHASYSNVALDPELANFLWRTCMIQDVGAQYLKVTLLGRTTPVLTNRPVY
jgi:hypothetical protein